MLHPQNWFKYNVKYALDIIKKQLRKEKEKRENSKAA